MVLLLGWIPVSFCPWYLWESTSGAGQIAEDGTSVLRDIFCGLYPAAVSLPICPGRPLGPLRYLITPFRILLLMLTR